MKIQCQQKKKLKYNSELTESERKWINEYRFKCCTPCWIKHLRPVFLPYYEYASQLPGSTETSEWNWKYLHFNKCPHKNVTEFSLPSGNR